MKEPNLTISPAVASTTDCKDASLLFPELCTRGVTVDFKAPRVSSDGGGVLLGRLDRSYGHLARFATCFTDHRDEELIEHSIYLAVIDDTTVI